MYRYFHRFFLVLAVAVPSAVEFFCECLHGFVVALGGGREGTGSFQVDNYVLAVALVFARPLQAPEAAERLAAPREVRLRERALTKSYSITARWPRRTPGDGRHQQCDA